LDIEGQAKFFADSFISAGPRDAIAQSKAEYHRLARQAAEFYESVSQKSAKIISMNEMPISNEYSMVKVYWGVTFEKTGDKPIPFDLVKKIVKFRLKQKESKEMWCDASCFSRFDNMK
jgi:hypothetical protein